MDYPTPDPVDASQGTGPGIVHEAALLCPCGVHPIPIVPLPIPAQPPTPRKNYAVTAIKATRV